MAGKEGGLERGAVASSWWPTEPLWSCPKLRQLSSQCPGALWFQTQRLHVLSPEIDHLQKSTESFRTFSLRVLYLGVAFSMLFCYFAALTERGAWLTPNASLDQWWCFRFSQCYDEPRHNWLFCAPWGIGCVSFHQHWCSTVCPPYPGSVQSSPVLGMLAWVHQR